MIKAIRSRIVMDLLESVDPFQLSHINENLDILDLLQWVKITNKVKFLMHRAKQGKGECLQHNLGWTARLGDHWAWGSEEPRLDKCGYQVLFGQVKKPLYLHYLINSWDKLMLSQSLKKLEIPFISQAGRHSTQSSWKCPVRFVRFPSTSWSEKFFPWLVSYWVHKLSNFDFRQDFMIDLGVGSGLKSQQDSLGCVSASLTQPKVVTFTNFLCDSKFV